MTADLHHIFAGIGIGARNKPTTIIQDAVAIAQGSEVQCMRGLGKEAFTLKEAAGQRHRIRTGKP